MIAIWMGLIGMLAFILGACTKEIRGLIDAISDRIRYGKSERPTKDYSHP